MFTVVVTYLDNSTEVIDGVTRMVPDENGIHLYQESHAVYGISKHLGSWPYQSIRKWRKIGSNE